MAVLTIISAIGIALLTPLAAARSALPERSETARLLDAAERPVGTIARGTLVVRDASLTSRLGILSTDAAGAIGVESFVTDIAMPTPASAPMEATLYLKPTPPPAPPVAPPPMSGNSITGKATWYCCSLNWRGQAVVALPGALGGRYDAPPASRYVTVCADRCVQLPVVDYCGCYWGTANQKVADLSPEAWAAVSDAPTSAGVITVTVHLGG